MIDSFFILAKSQFRIITKIHLFLIWSKINFKYFFLSPFFDIKTEKFLGMTIKFFNYETFRYLFEEVFIRNEYYFLSKNKKPIIFDCGANIGMTVLFFKWLYPESTIYAFEPNMSSYSLLESNTHSNNFSKVKIENIAIGDKNSRINFFFDPNDPGSIVASSLIGRAQSTQTSARVKKLSDYIDNYKISKVDFLKMDIEGSEFVSVIELSKNNKLQIFSEMVIEYHHNIMNSKSSLATLLSQLEKLKYNYQIYTKPIPLYKKNSFQDILLYIYK